MPTIALPLGGGAYRARSPSADSQTCVNLYPEQDDTGRSKIVLYGTPGLTSFATLTAGPTRGMHVMGDVLYVVGSGSLYRVSSAGVVTDLGAIAGTGMVRMADNGTQLIIVNGTQGYIYTTGTGLVSITDVDYLPSYTVDFVDGYFVGAAVGTQQWYVSALNDGTSYNGLDYASAESQPDGIVAVKVFRGEVWLLGQHTTEVWYNAANPTGNPFSRQQSATMQRGCQAKYSVAIDRDALYWLGDDGVVYQATSYSPQRISTHAIEYDIGQTSVTDDAIGWTYQFEGHAFYVLTFPSGKTWVYDNTTKMWHQRKSYGLDRWRGQFSALCYGEQLVGDYATTAVGYLNYDDFDEYGNPLRWERTLPIIDDDNRGIFIDRVEIVMESGVGTSVNPVVNLEMSTDGGRTWGFPQEANIGAIGQYRWRSYWNQLGWAENWSLRFWSSDAYRRVLIDGSIQMESGEA